VSRKITTPPSRSFAPGKSGTFLVLTLLAGLSALVAAGCETTFTPGPLTASWQVGGTWYAEPPYEITSYPHVWYGDRWLYLVDGVWYAPTAEGWIILRDEPRELGRYRRYYEPDSPRRYAPSPPRERGRYRSY
jgi:hypothetical protein